MQNRRGAGSGFKKKGPSKGGRFAAAASRPKRKSASTGRERDNERDGDGEEDVAPPKPASEKLVLQRFAELWKGLFESPVHLDSALSKLPRSLKTTLAQIVPQILLRPVSQAELLGIGIEADEPWKLQPKSLSQWRPAQIQAQRLYGMMSSRSLSPAPQPEDFPPAMVAEWASAWGRESMLKLVSVLGQEAPLSLRASRKLGAEGLLKGLKQGNWLPVKAEKSGVSPLGVRLAGYAPVLGSDLYKKASFEIQDEGSQVMALFALWPERFASLLQKAPGPVDEASLRLPEVPTEVPPWTVVDACAGAGGKSLALADAMGGRGRIFAYDISAIKLQALRRRATHAGFNNIQAVALKEGEEAAVIGKFRRRAHVVLVDAPCSGWGVLRRNPDIKWRQSPDSLARLPEIQLRLLSQYSQLVAGEGRLVYGTCTFRPAETTELVARFLAAHPEFEAREGGYLGPGPSDGFFMQSFVRRKG
jgi:16S rRNA C967 or C1407 C5-methylase (RsmB/RsmF family)